MARQHGSIFLADVPCMYDIGITLEARRPFNHLPEKVHAAMFDFFSTLARDPWRVGKPLLDEFTGMLSARRSEYRIVYEVDEDRKTVTVHRVAHRRDIYRRR